MHQVILEVVMDERMRRQLILTGVAMLIIGALGVVVPQVLSFTLSLLVGALLIAAGLVSAYLAWYGYRRSPVTWFKPAILLIIGALIAFHPGIGAAALGLVLILYFAFSAFAGITLALSFRPLPGWGWMLFSGLVSLVLAIVFIAGWPFQAQWLVGLFVGINLIFDGVSLLMAGLAARPE